ncbi:MAG: hypothetical protein OXT49_04710 [Gammaproteobacteria bacterium]|nr:hypothetical protein [Gammaproteobacteria bacterium]
MSADSGNPPDKNTVEDSASKGGDWAERRLGQIRTALLGEELAEIEARLGQAQATITETMSMLEDRAGGLAKQIADLELQLQAEMDRATPREDLASLLRSVADKLENGDG